MTCLSQSDVFLDLCTQIDYLGYEGARRCTNAADVLPSLRRLMAVARWEKLPTISCIDARSSDEVRGLRSAECVVGSRGQRKLHYTLLPNRAVVESDNCLCIPLDLLERVQQVVFVKRHRDPFTNPKLDRLLTEMPAKRFVVFGLPLEGSLRLMVLGLLLRSRRVTLVRDACGFWNAPEAEMTLRQLEAKGCEILDSDEYARRALGQHNVAYRGRPGPRRSVA
ncbi:MAG: isochorismatase family protein [Phycisphaerales bacterium]|nr:isochorismatase family protein [Phycisphaerales bacterium]